VKILVLNSGSSSLKFQLFNGNELLSLATGLIEQIGEQTGHAHLLCTLPERKKEEIKRTLAIADQGEAISVMIELLQESGQLAHLDELSGIGHRVVHGGESFHQPVLINRQVMATIGELIPLAPLHNPANLTGIEATMDQAPAIPQVAVFDTAFHQSLPPHSYLYGLPYALYRENKVRRYGFHGTSHHYVGKAAARFLQRPFSELRLVTLHLGNGASAAAISQGSCRETSMGMTPLEGLVMGTRSGDLDPAILFYLARETGMSLNELDQMLNKESGLKGICGDNDMRTITGRIREGDRQAELALDIFCHRLKKYIGAYLAVLGGADGLVFTGGIGEHSAEVRHRACLGLEGLGIQLDPEKNTLPSSGTRAIHHPGSKVSILVIPTDEEREIAAQTLNLISSFPRP